MWKRKKTWPQPYCFHKNYEDKLQDKLFIKCTLLTDHQLVRSGLIQFHNVSGSGLSINCKETQVWNQGPHNIWLSVTALLFGSTMFSTATAPCVQLGSQLSSSLPHHTHLSFPTPDTKRGESSSVKIPHTCTLRPPDTTFLTTPPLQQSQRPNLCHTKSNISESSAILNSIMCGKN